MVCVRPGVLLVNASFLWPVRALIKLDLPTLLLPKNATSGNRSEGKVSGLPELTTNSAFKELIPYLGNGLSSPYLMCNRLFGRLLSGYVQLLCRRNGQGDNFPNERDLQDLVHGFDEVQLHGLLDGIWNVGEVLFILPRHDGFQDAMTVGGHQLLLK